MGAEPAAGGIFITLLASPAVSEALGIVVGALAGLISAPLASMIVARPPLMDATEPLGLPFRCDACVAAVKPIDALPIVSYLTTGGRCRTCRARIAWHQPLTEVLSVGVGALIGWRIGWSAILIVHLIVGFVTVCVVLIDYRLHKIPTKLVYPAAGLAAVAVLVAAAVDGNTSALVRAGLGALLASGFLWILVLFVPAGMGQGDARLALLLGLMLGWHGWKHIYLGILAGFLLGSIFGIGVIIVKRASGSTVRSGLKTQIAFGPYLCAGALIVALWPTIAG